MQSEVGVSQITGDEDGVQVQSEVGCIRGRPAAAELARRNSRRSGAIGSQVYQGAAGLR